MRKLAGRWRIVSMPELEGYLELGEEPPYLRLKVSQPGSVYGDYAYGLSGGRLDGADREFGGERILVFGYEGWSEMDSESGGGWLRLTGPDALEGEFVNVSGVFQAEREKARKPRGRRGKSTARSMSRGIGIRISR